MTAAGVKPPRPGTKVLLQHAEIEFLFVFRPSRAQPEPAEAGELSVRGYRSVHFGDRHGFQGAVSVVHKLARVKLCPWTAGLPLLDVKQRLNQRTLVVLLTPARSMTVNQLFFAKRPARARPECNLTRDP